MEKYSEKEWKSAIASLGRTCDIRNFPDAASDLLLGKAPAYRGRGTSGKKLLDPKVIPALALWTKGPVEMIVEHDGMRRVLETYDSHKAVIGIQLTVTGFGGSFLEPGIPSPEETAKGLAKVLQTGFVDPGAILLRYDPVLKIQCPDGSVLTNSHAKAFEKVVLLFGRLGVNHFSTKFLLYSESEQKYSHVHQRLKDFGITAIPIDDQVANFNEFKKIADRHGVKLKSCCVRVEQGIEDWPHDAGCLSGHQLTMAGKKRYGQSWDRITTDLRPSRPGCLCTRYWDLSVNMHFKKCGGDRPACLYCTASSKNGFGEEVKSRVASELQAYMSGAKRDEYEHLVGD